MKSRDSVSVVIPCYKQAGFLSEAIESVLAQTYPYFEIIVVDDGSPDNTSEVASRYPGVRCIRQENRGLSAARNTGIRESKSGFLVFLDADDRLTANALKSGLHCLRAMPDAAIAVGRHKNISAEGSPLATSEERYISKDHYADLLRANFIGCPATVMYRRSVFDEVAGFDTSLNPASDYDLYLRIARKFPICCHTAFVAEYRKHGENMSNNHVLMSEYVIRVLRSQLEQVVGNKKYEEACRTGIKFYQHVYQIAIIVERMQNDVRRKAWSSTIRNLLLLLWADPLVFGEELRRKVRRVVFKRKLSCAEISREEAR